MKQQLEIKADNKRIAKNTMLLYLRMLLIMAVTLYTSRVILDKLGTSDYGIYNTVGGVVAMFGFLNGALGTGTSRFLTVEIGKQNFSRLKLTFSTAFYAHLILACIIVVLLEIGGTWFLYNKLIIPSERFTAALWTFQISVFTSFVGIIQVPYTSIIVARENMKIYAYVGLLDAFARLAVVFILSFSDCDHLIFYAALIAVVQLLVSFLYFIYCGSNYKETHLRKHVDKNILKEMLGFSSWNLLANISQIISTQGIIVVINMFFQPVVVAAQAIGNQISTAIMSFVNNFRMAINPQIIKLYAVGEYQESRKLTLESTIYVFDMLLLLVLPVVVLMKPILNIWLVKVPDYAVVFSQYIVASQLLNVYNVSLYTVLTASGKLKGNSIISSIVMISGFFLLYVLLKCGFDVMWVQYFSIFQLAVNNFIIKPIILCKYIPGYNCKYILKNAWQCIKVAIVPVSTSIILYNIYPVHSIFGMIIVSLILMLTVCISSLTFMKKEAQVKIFVYVMSKLHK